MPEHYWLAGCLASDSRSTAVPCSRMGWEKGGMGFPPTPQGGFACRRLAVCFGASKGMPVIMKKPARKDRSYFLNIKMSFGVQSRIVQSFSRVVVVIPRLCFKLLIVREFMPHFSMSVYVDIFFCFINSHKGA